MDKVFKPFAIDDIFIIKSGKRLVSADSTVGRRPFIGALDNSNGVARFVDDINGSLDKNVLGVNYNGNGMVVGFYHPYECIFSDDVKRFHMKEVDDGKDILLYTKVPIFKQKNKFGYLYKFNAKRMEKTKILLPVDKESKPDYGYMCSFAEAMRKTLLQRYREYITHRISKLQYEEVPTLNEVEWGLFRIGNLFEVKRPAARSKDDYDEGNMPFVASGATNNGVMKCCKPTPYETPDKGGCITVSPVDGSAFYQPYDFLGRGGAGSSILMLYNDRLSEANGQFIARMVSQTCSKYTYGHMGNKDSIKRETIQLPIGNDGEPDYAYMEQYAKNMMLKKYKQYLAFIDSIPQTIPSDQEKG